MNKQEEKEKEIKILLSTLRQQLEDESKDLGLILKQKKEAIAIAGSARDEFVQIRESKEKYLINMQTRTRDAENELALARSLAKQREKENEVLRKQRNELMNELNRLNDWLINAKKEQSDIQFDIQKNSRVKKKLFKVVKDLEDKISILTEERAKIWLDMKLSLENIAVAEEQIDKKVTQNEKKLEKIQSEITKAKENYLNVVNQTKKIEKDLEIYTARVKNEYESAFPKRKMKL